jgi:hypothetical protein
MSTFRRYGGLNYSANNNITRSRISNSEQLNVNNYSGQQNSKEVFACHVDMSGNSILHTGCIYFQDGTSICTGSGAQGDAGPPGIKTFVIDHPCDKNKYLVHACLEGPEAGVYYRGEGKITNNKNTIIKLPYYVDKLASQLTVNLTPIYDSDTMDNEIELETIVLKSSRVKNNAFTVYGPTCEFFWTVYGKRNEINVEPLKRLTDIKGTGPYKWI